MFTVIISILYVRIWRHWGSERLSNCTRTHSTRDNIWLQGLPTSIILLINTHGVFRLRGNFSVLDVDNSLGLIHSWQCYLVIWLPWVLPWSEPSNSFSWLMQEDLGLLGVRCMAYVSTTNLLTARGGEILLTSSQQSRNGSLKMWRRLPQPRSQQVLGLRFEHLCHAITQWGSQTWLGRHLPSLCWCLKHIVGTQKRVMTWMHKTSPLWFQTSTEGFKGAGIGGGFLASSGDIVT